MDVTPGLIIKETPASMAAAAADIFAGVSKKSIHERGFFAAALSGGSTPRAAYRILGEEPYLSQISWAAVHLFWVDERCVPADSPASNYGAAKKDFLEKIPVPDSQAHPMPGEKPPEEGALLYEKELKAFFQPTQSGFPAFDLIFLGAGKDGHTASLFPGRPVPAEKKRWAAAVKGGDPDLDRLTLTLPVLNQARQVVFLVSGEGKAAMVRAVFENKQAKLPVQMINPKDAKTTWLLDRPAASMLSGST